MPYDNIKGICSPYLVINPSINPAIIKNGMVLTTIFKPSLAPLVKATRLEYVLGNKKLFPITSPAQPAITITEISIVPCNQIVEVLSKIP